MSEAARIKIEVDISRWGRGSREFSVTVSGKLIDVLEAVCTLGDLSLDMWRFPEVQSSSEKVKEET